MVVQMLTRPVTVEREIISGTFVFANFYLKVFCDIVIPIQIKMLKVVKPEV